MLNMAIFDGGALDVLRGMNAMLGAVERWAFFTAVFDWVDEEINIFRENLLGSMGEWVGGIAFTFFTLWILLQGYRIVTGQSKQYMMSLVVNSLKWMLLLTVATGFALGSSHIHQLLADDMPRLVNNIVTGDDEGPENAIDEGLQELELVMAAIDALYVNWDETLQEAKTRNMWFTGIGVAGPSLIGGALLLMYKMGLALFVGLGPFFILCLGFDQTKNMFPKWVWYGVGTMFSMAVLSFSVSMITKLLTAVAVSFAVQYGIAMAVGASPTGVNSMAMMQGGLGILMTMFLITIPAMASSFFQGTLGHFMAHSAMGRQMKPAVPGQPGAGSVPVPPAPNPGNVGASEASSVRAGQRYGGS